MADDTREKASIDSMPRRPEPPKKIPKGVVLGPDGKPCRTCSTGTAFASWVESAKKITTSRNVPATDCPPDVEELGRSSWTLLHSITATYPVAPTVSQQSDVTQFLKLFAKLYPCWVCAEDFERYMERNRIRVESRDDFGRWMCEAHNDVNIKLGKRVFDCDKWEERWRTG